MRRQMLLTLLILVFLVSMMIPVDAKWNLDFSQIDTMATFTDTTNTNFPSMLKISTDVWAVVYSSSGDDGHLATFALTEDTGDIGAQIDTWEFDTTKGTYPSIVHVTDNLYYIVYRDTGTDLQMFTFTITSAGDITNVKLDTEAVDVSGSCGSYQSSSFLINNQTDYSYWVIFYTGDGGDGWMKTYNITHATGAIVAIDNYEWDTGNGQGIRAQRIGNSNIFLLLSQSGGGWFDELETYKVNDDGTISKSLINRLRGAGGNDWCYYLFPYWRNDADDQTSFCSISPSFSYVDESGGGMGITTCILTLNVSSSGTYTMPYDNDMFLWWSTSSSNLRSTVDGWVAMKHNLFLLSFATPTDLPQLTYINITDDSIIPYNLTSGGTYPSSACFGYPFTPKSGTTITDAPSIYLVKEADDYSIVATVARYSDSNVMRVITYNVTYFDDAVECPECPECNSTNLTMYDDIINATGTHESSYDPDTGWNVWANYTGNASTGECDCNSTNLTLYDFLINCTGWHNSSYNSTTGWSVWANYTGNTSSSCPSIETVIITYLDTYSMYIIPLILFVIFFVVGYTSTKRSGGFFLLFAGFALLAILVEARADINIFISAIMAPFSFFIMLIGVKKAFYHEEKKEKAKTNKT